MGGENVCALHMRASCWYEQQGNITEAVEHAFNAGAWERARNRAIPAALIFSSHCLTPHLPSLARKSA
jgi:ATP/maltotriose-dependent transcriptional regulator MalT